jgi:hypothetical protein
MPELPTGTVTFLLTDGPDDVFHLTPAELRETATVLPRTARRLLVGARSRDRLLPNDRSAAIRWHASETANSWRVTATPVPLESCCRS